MNIAILGYGVEGLAAYNYWRSAENHITVCDKNKALQLPDDVSAKLGDDYLGDLDKFDLIVRSPSVHPKDIARANSPDILSKVTSNTNEFFRACPTKNIIGVTGTKGKGTTSTLIAKMLEAASKHIHLGGNIGVAPLALLAEDIQPSDYVVLELSSYQLIDLKYAPHTAVCLMMVPEHLDWHGDIGEYITSKQQLFAHQKPEDIAIYYASNETSKKIAEVSLGQKIPYCAKPGAVVDGGEIKIAGQTICRTDELQLPGKHNWQNVCAAITAVWYSLSAVEGQVKVKAMRQVLTNFAGLPHRLEFVREASGIKFYNDSFASTPDAAVAAIEAIAGQKVMIIGGFDRKLPLENFAKDVAGAQDIRKVLLIGASAERAAEALQAAGFSNFQVSAAKDMAEIVHEAEVLAQPGDSVVLSPGFPSFDMFKNFEERGLLFKEAVNKL